MERLLRGGSGTRRFFVNGIILTVSSLVLRAVGIGFNAYLTTAIGAEGMGLFQLALSVYSLAATFASSGVSIAMTRVLSERGEGNPRRIMRNGLALSLCLSIAAAGLLLGFAGPISTGWLQDERTASSLRLLAPSLVFMAAAGCLNGYFLAERQIAWATAGSVFEQLVRIILTIAGMIILRPTGIEALCLVVVGASVIADLLGVMFNFAVYLFLVRKVDYTDVKPIKYYKKIASIAVPVAASGYVRAGLRTVENLLIPWGLGLYGYSRSDALAGFGILKSMVMPIVYFPSTVVGSFASLLVPELARISKEGDKERIKSIVRKVFPAVLLYSIFCAGALSMFAEGITGAIYKGSDMAGLLRRMALLVPVMYLDHATDAMLNALNQQVSTLKINLTDSAIRVGLLAAAIPLWGFDGYVAVMFASTLFNAFLSVRRLLTVTGVKMLWRKWVFSPAMAAAASLCAARIACATVLSGLPEVPLLIAGIALAACVFAVLAKAFGLLPGGVRGRVPSGVFAEGCPPHHPQGNILPPPP